MQAILSFTWAELGIGDPHQPAPSHPCLVRITYSIHPSEGALDEWHNDTPLELTIEDTTVCWESPDEWCSIPFECMSFDQIDGFEKAMQEFKRDTLHEHIAELSAGYPEHILGGGLDGQDYTT